MACTSDGNACTVDACDGAGACVHPPGNPGTLCRTAAGDCDVAEMGNGTNAACPADGFVPDGSGCSGGNTCTIADQCTSGVCAGDPMTCGDGILQAGCTEECDDGNLTNDDGCDATCQLEPCAATPDPACKLPVASGKSSVKFKNNPIDDTKDAVQFKWSAGAATDKLEFGDPVTVDEYWFCLYNDGTLVSTTRIASGGICDGKPCWADKPKGFSFKAKTPNGDGATKLKRGAGESGKAKIQFKGKGANLDVPHPMGVSGSLVAQVVKAGDGTCWSATFSAPFTKQDTDDFNDKAD